MKETFLGEEAGWIQFHQKTIWESQCWLYSDSWETWYSIQVWRVWTLNFFKKRTTRFQISGQIDVIDDIDLKEDEKHEYKETETQTNSPFKCGKFSEEIFDDTNAWKMHMSK